MIAYPLALTALLALSNVSSVKADNKEPFTVDIGISFDVDQIGDSDKKTISDCVVTSFNEVHDTSVIELYTFSMKSFDPSPGMLGGYSYGSGGGGNCRACGNDDMLSTELTFSHNKWAKSFIKCVDASGSDALAKASNAVIKVGGEATALAAQLSDKEPFEVDIGISFDDPDADQVGDADKKIISDCVVTSFNEVHDTSVIELYTFSMKSFDPTPGMLGGYSYGSGGGGNCRACGNDDMLSTELTFSHNKWAKSFIKCVDSSGSDALAKASNAVIKVGGESASMRAVHDPNKEDFTFNLEITFMDPDAAKITDADKPIFEDCVVSSFNAVHDTEVIELYTFDLKTFDPSPGTIMSLLRGSPSMLGGYSYGSGGGGNCRACGNDDMLNAGSVAYTHNKWEEALKKCLAASGSAGLAKAHHVSIKIEGTDVSQQMM